MISSLSQGGGNLLDHHFLIVLKSARNKRNVLRDYLRNLAGKGEKALAKKLTPEQRPEKARRQSGRKRLMLNEYLYGT